MKKAKRRFEYKDEKSNKFWEIELDGKAYTTYYAKIGNNPQSDTNSYESEEEALEEYEKKIKSKEKKGYVEVDEASAGEDKNINGSKYKYAGNLVSMGNAMLVGVVMDKESSKKWKGFTEHGFAFEDMGSADQFRFEEEDAVMLNFIDSGISTIFAKEDEVLFISVVANEEKDPKDLVQYLPEVEKKKMKKVGELEIGEELTVVEWSDTEGIDISLDRGMYEVFYEIQNQEKISISEEEYIMVLARIIKK